MIFDYIQKIYTLRASAPMLYTDFFGIALI